MTHIRWILALLTLAPAVSHALCNPNSLRPNLLEPCPTLPDQLTAARDAAQQFVGAIDKQAAEIAAARARFFKEFPNGAGYADAEAKFLEALTGKDMTYLQFALPMGMDSDLPKLVNFMDMMGGGNTLLTGEWRKFPAMLDGGVRPYAFPLFVNWVRAMRAAEGRTKDGTYATYAILPKAQLDRSNERQAYERARNWAELMTGPVDVAKHFTPKQYMLLQMDADVSYVALQSKTKPAPNGWQATQDLYAFFEKTFGEKEVAAAAAATLRAPKNKVGGLATRVPMEIGGYVGFESPNPYMLFLTTLTKGSPHAYAVALCIDPYANMQSSYIEAYNTKETWEKAAALYDQVVAKYGEATTLAAAARLSAVEKDDKGGPRGDPKNNGSRYWFQALLKDPKLPLPELARLRVGAYDERWLGHLVQVRGTVTRVDYEKGGSPPYAVMHFKEGGLVAYTPNSDMWQAAWGQDFGAVIGGVVEVWGDVNEFRGAGGVRVLDHNQATLLAAGAPVQVAESHPEWLNAPLVAPTFVESPEYAGWKKFPVGTAARFTTYLMTEYQPGTDTYTRAVLTRDTVTLTALDAEHASVSYRSSGPGNNDVTYNAKVREKPDTDTRKLTRGDETLSINGKSFATHWEKRERENDPYSFTMIWRSDQVPGGIVRRKQQENRGYGTDKPNRSIQDMLFAPVEGADAELTANAARAGASAAPPAAPSVAPQAAPASPPPPTTQPPAGAAANGGATAPASLPPLPSQPRVDTSRMPPEIARQVEFSQRFNAVTARMTRARNALVQRQRAGNPAPPGIMNAEQRLNSEMTAVTAALGARNVEMAEQSLRTFDGSVAAIEQFLAK
jgi:hypothetical protein